MISVLIPTYNYKCYTLAHDLQKQLEASGEDYEVIVAEDGGKDQVVVISNHRINDLPCCRYIRRTQNVGRAAIRNFLANEAKGEWLLFMDSDAKVVADDYIGKYIAAMKDGDADVIVGGLMNPEKLPSPIVTLRYRYEKTAEYQRPAAYRQRYPYARFTAFNVMMHRSVLQEIPFDESCREYGYEDALMGIEMMQKGKKIRHIDNPLMHLGFESNEVFLRKTEIALKTLHRLEDRMFSETSIGSVVMKVRRYHLVGTIAFTFRAFRNIMKRNLYGSAPNLKVFAFYKLGYYLNLK